MKDITQIRKLSLWIFFTPLLAINLCLLISQNYEILENLGVKILKDEFDWKCNYSFYDLIDRCIKKNYYKSE